MEASQVGKTYWEQLELALSFVVGSSASWAGQLAPPAALDQETEHSCAAVVR